MPGQSFVTKNKKIVVVPKKPEKIGNGRYMVGKEIGKGAFGRVYKCFDSVTSKVIAVKAIQTKGITAQQLKSIKQEVELLANLPPHDNIVRYYESFDEDGCLYMVMEFIENGSLLTLLKSFGGYLPENSVITFSSQILSGLKFLHEEAIIHRDIKAANVLLGTQGVAKLADFGVAVRHDKTGGGNAIISNDDIAGSPYWMAPEVIEMIGGVTSKCDIWAVGATVIELMTGKPPYWDLPPLSALYKISQEARPPFPPKCSKLCEGFLSDCFQRDPGLRPDADKLLKHPWIKSILDKPIVDDHNNNNNNNPSSNNKSKKSEDDSNNTNTNTNKNKNESTQIQKKDTNEEVKNLSEMSDDSEEKPIKKKSKKSKKNEKNDNEEDDEDESSGSWGEMENTDDGNNHELQPEENNNENNENINNKDENIKLEDKELNENEKEIRQKILAEDDEHGVDSEDLLRQTLSVSQSQYRSFLLSSQQKRPSALGQNNNKEISLEEKKKTRRNCKSNGK